MLTKGMIMTVSGIVGIIITIVTFIILNKNIKKQLNVLMESEISVGQYESSINDKINRYVMKINNYEQVQAEMINCVNDSVVIDY